MKERGKHYTVLYFTFEHMVKDFSEREGFTVLYITFEHMATDFSEREGFTV